MKRPSFQFYPGDWQRDTALRLCSIGARGCWWEMVCIMHQAEPYGHLMHEGRALQAKHVASLIGGGATTKQVQEWFDELEAEAVFARTEDGCIYSRRMVRDEATRMARANGGSAGAEHGNKGAEHGKKGGRPRKDTGDKKPPSDGDGKPPLKPPPSFSSSSSSSFSNEIGESSGITSGEESAGTAPPPPPDQDRPTQIAVWLRKAEKARGKQPTGTMSSDERIRSWADRGVTDAQLSEAYELAVADRECAEDASPIGPGFLDVFVGKLLNPAPARPRKEYDDWAKSDAGIDRKARELGMFARGGEDYPSFRERIREELRRREGRQAA